MYFICEDKMNYNWAATEWPEVNSNTGSEVRLSFFKKPWPR